MVEHRDDDHGNVICEAMQLIRRIAQLHDDKAHGGAVCLSNRVKLLGLVMTQLGLRGHRAACMAAEEAELLTAGGGSPACPLPAARGQG